MRICLTLDSAAFTQIPRVGRVSQPTPDFTGSGRIDALYQATLDAKQTKDEALESLWGPVLATSIPLQVYAEGACAKGKNNSAAGAGIFFHRGSPLNTALRVPGPGRLTADRARIFAIHEAIRRTPTDQNLLVFCTSKMIVRQFCYLAAKNSQLGWPGNNGDLFKSTVRLLAAREA
ncbi:hypothetical protein C8R46DRAFT_899469, partial [Mycena filopes]